MKILNNIEASVFLYVKKFKRYTTPYNISIKHFKGLKRIFEDLFVIMSQRFQFYQIKTSFKCIRVTFLLSIVWLQNVTKTRMVEHCCEGYTERTENNITICEPNFIGGCLKGTCEAPNKCKCDVGFMGKHCNFSKI